MSDMHRLEIEFDDHCYEALLAEADRLQMGIEQIVERAAAAWITEIAENTASVSFTPTVTVLS
jgi:glutamate-1-semialdehyde aminotransferase